MQFYNEWSKRLLSGNWTDHYAFYGLPGYAFLVAGIYKTFFQNPILITALQAGIEAFLSFLIYSIANLIFAKGENRHFSSAIGIFAGVGYAFYLPSQAFASVMMPTTLAAAAFWLIVWWCLRSRVKEITWMEALAVGIGIGCMAMMVATIFFVLPLVLLALIQKSTALSKSIPLLLVGVILGCSPAILHNRWIAHDMVMLSAHGGLNFFIGNNAEADGYLKIPSGLRANQAQMLADSISVAEKALGGGQNIPRSAVSAYWSNQASAYIHEHPVAWLRLLGQKIINFWNAYQYDDLSIIRALGEERITTLGLHFGIVAALGLAGICVALGSEHVKSRWVVAAIFLHLASLLTVFITERYRLAAVPGLIIMAAYFIVQLWENAACARWKCAVMQSATLIVWTIFVTLPVPNQGAWALDTYNSGIRYLAKKDANKASEQLQLAWRYAPENDNTNLAVGNLYLLQNDLTRASLFFQRAIRLNSRNTAALNNLGYIALSQNSPASAVSYYSQSLELDPGNILAAYQLATAYWKNQNPSQALQTLDQALILHPKQEQLLELRSKISSNP